MSAPSEAGLIIKLDKEQQSYLPGDPVRGTLQLHLNKDSPVGKVSIRFSGSTESKIVQSNGQSTSEFRGSAELFNDVRALHDDHYTHKSGLLSWPFEFQIPTTVDPANIRSKWEQRDGFLATSDGAAIFPLPPSFQFADSTASRAWRAYTSYAIEATVIQAGDYKLAKPKTKRLTKVIRVLPLPIAEGVDMHDPRQRRGVPTTLTVQTLRLLPEHAGELSIMQRTKSIFNTSKLPKFTFEVDVSYTSTIQAYASTSLPFVVSGYPKTDIRSTTVQPEQRNFYRYPSLKVKHVKLVLQAHTSCRCPSVLSDVYADTIHDIPLVDRYLSNTSLAMRSFAWDQKNRVEEQIPTSIDFGKEYGIVVTKDSREDNQKVEKAKVLDNSSGRIRTFVTPSFQSYNISRRYYFAWSLQMECAGEKITLDGRSAEEITVLGPSAGDTGELLPDDAFWVIPGEDGNSENDEVQRTQSNKGLPPAYSELPGAESTVLDSTSAEPRGKTG
ncbi:hypothetical protein PMZ80_000226 [Knufia obscura]|uniref:Arrestin-like N-terminal domain-containing protein n=1 Tax=Knufia obscura TaxID=1635080 RepID=A0ABR0S0A3_9EURO|nr:hypothetical protein PMZ80_000226 [Knufia obscura]